MRSVSEFILKHAAAVLLACTVGGCAAFGAMAGVLSGRSAALIETNALADASLDLQAYALIASWAQLQEQAAVIAASPDTSRDVRDLIHLASDAGTSVMLALSHAAEVYTAAPDATSELELAMGNARAQTEYLVALVSVTAVGDAGKDSE